MTLQLAPNLSIGVQTIHRRTEPATGPWLPSIDELVEFVQLVDSSGYESIWTGDHISFPASILDPLLQLAQAAIVSRRLVFGTGVYLLPLRHPVPVATTDGSSKARPCARFSRPAVALCSAAANCASSARASA